MEGLVSLRNALEARHAEYFSRSWDSLSADDAKRFSQIERDIIAVNAALGKSEPKFSPDLEVVLERLSAIELSNPVERTGKVARNRTTEPALTARRPYRPS
jgi:hypothetical protein